VIQVAMPSTVSVDLVYPKRPLHHNAHQNVKVPSKPETVTRVVIHSVISVESVSLKPGPQHPNVQQSAKEQSEVVNVTQAATPTALSVDPVSLKPALHHHSAHQNARKHSVLEDVTPHATDTTPYVESAPPPHHHLCRVDTSLHQRAAGASPPSLGTVFSSSHGVNLLGRPLGKYEALL